MKHLIDPDKSKCVKCRACAEICPMGVIDLSEEGYPVPIEDAFKLCINCGYCVDICDFAALNHAVRKRNTTTAAAKKRLQRKREINKLLDKPFRRR
ncbi:MAG: 4Fe-4S binding protein [Lachnospiraceae bacterium]|nr:4Fe-4S binding protein [Lachnospiraceae bacterium]